MLRQLDPQPSSQHDGCENSTRDVQGLRTHLTHSALSSCSVLPCPSPAGPSQRVGPWGSSVGSRCHCSVWGSKSGAPALGYDPLRRRDSLYGHPYLIEPCLAAKNGIGAFKTGCYDLGVQPSPEPLGSGRFTHPYRLCESVPLCIPCGDQGCFPFQRGSIPSIPSWEPMSHESLGWTLGSSCSLSMLQAAQTGPKGQVGQLSPAFWQALIP